MLCVCAYFFVSCQGIVNTPPSGYELQQNFPNPFIDTTVIIYGIPYIGQGATGPKIRVVVNDRFNVTQATLVSTSNHPAGTFRVVWNGRGANHQKVAPGIYFIELQQLNDGTMVQGRCVALKQ